MQQGTALITHIPRYFKRVQEIIVDPDFPWLSMARPRRQEQGRLRSGQPSRDLAARLLLLAVDRRQGACFVRLDPDRHAGGDLLSDLRLALDDCHHRWLDPAAPARHRAPAGAARSTRRSAASCADRLGVCLVLGIYYAIALMVVGLDFALLIGLVAGRDHVRALYRLDDRADDRDERRDRAVLAGLETDRGGDRHLPGRPVRGRQHRGAEIRRRARRPAPASG